MISFLNFAEPVTLVRSPILMKLAMPVMPRPPRCPRPAASNISSPDSRMRRTLPGTLRGILPATASAMARICSGVVPQQPPTMFTSPASAHSPRWPAVSSGVSS